MFNRTRYIRRCNVMSYIAFFTMIAALPVLFFNTSTGITLFVASLIANIFTA